ncbi:MAG: leucine-rich repeat domain-containing protein, partial [Clostridia bacterium]|nr:leucine-rich repeat domain-containing protein [Clostridia bacterium]
SLTIYCEARNETMAWESSWNSSSCPVVMDCNNKDVASDGYIYTVIDGIRYAIKDGVAMVARQPKNIVSAIIPTRITYKGNNYKVTSIGRSAFYECDSLKKVEIPSSIESIDTGAFSKCNGLTKIFIHSYVESVSVSAFRDCDNLTIYCEAQSKPTDWHSGWNFSSIIPVKWGHTHSYTGGECICGKTR